MPPRKKKIRLPLISSLIITVTSISPFFKHVQTTLIYLFSLPRKDHPSTLFSTGGKSPSGKYFSFTSTLLTIYSERIKKPPPPSPRSIFLEELLLGYFMIRVWKRGSSSRSPAPFSREFRILHLFPSLSQIPFFLSTHHIERAIFCKS